MCARGGGRREGERQLEKIYPRVVKGKDVGVPRLAADEMDAGFHADPLEGMRTDGWTDGWGAKGCRRSRCIDAPGAAASPMGDRAGPGPPSGCRRSGGRGRGDAGGGRGCEPASRSPLSRRVGSARRPMRGNGFSSNRGISGIELDARGARRLSQGSHFHDPSRGIFTVYRAKMYAFLRI